VDGSPARMAMLAPGKSKRVIPLGTSMTMKVSKSNLWVAGTGSEFNSPLVDALADPVD